MNSAYAICVVLSIGISKLSSLGMNVNMLVYCF